MMDYTGENVYTKLGARPVINAGGNTTVWGGSAPSPAVKRAMDEAGMAFVGMEELLEKSGEFIANLLDVDDAYVTSGCYAALVLSTAACVTGNDPDKMARLPDTSGMKSEIILQQSHRYGYDRAYTIPGSKLVIVGDEDGCTPEQMESAITSNTAAVAYQIKADDDRSSVSLKDTVGLAHSHNVPVIADAASQIYPIDYFRRNAQSADLVCFGGKYMSAPHSTGLACGRKELMEAVTAHGFIGPRPLGRGMKLDRQEIIGLVAAIEDWFTMDHEERLLGYGARFTPIEDALKGVSTVRATKVIHSNAYWGVGLHVVLDTESLGKSAPDVVDELDQGVPRIRAAAANNDTILINVHNFGEDDEDIVADRLRSLLTAGR